MASSLPSLPNEKPSCSESETVLPILPTPTSSPPHLETLTDVTIDAEFWEVLRRMDISNLRQIEVRSFGSLEDITRLAEAVPQLTCLHINLSPVELKYMKCDTSRDFTSMWIAAISSFANLRHLYVKTVLIDILFPSGKLALFTKQHLPLLEKVVLSDGCPDDFLVEGEISNPPPMPCNDLALFTKHYLPLSENIVRRESDGLSGDFLDLLSDDFLDDFQGERPYPPDIPYQVVFIDSDSLPDSFL